MLYFDGLCCGAVLEVEPSEVLIRSHEQQDRQEQLNASSSGSPEVVREALFSCLQVESDESRHRPRSEVIWMKDGVVIVTKGNRKYRNYGKKKKLLINNTGVADSGVYECALSPNATEKGRAELWIVPEIWSAPTPQILQGGAGGGDVGVVKCQVSLGTQYIEWWRDNVQLAVLNLTYNGTSEAADLNYENLRSPYQDSHYSILRNGSLVISSVSGSDAGMYRCVAVNKAGRRGREIRLVINSSYDDENLQQIGTTPPDSGANLTSKNSSLPDVPSGRNCIEYEDFTFGPNPELPSLPPPPVMAMSGGGAHPPFFTSLSPPCVESLVGYRIILNCSAGGSPSPNITWEKDGETLWTRRYDRDLLEARVKHQTHHFHMPDGSLLINTVQLNDQGKYLCRATNSEGEVTEEVRLRVKKTQEVCGTNDNKIRSEVDGSGSGSEKEHQQRRKRIAYGEAVDDTHHWPWQVLIEYSGNDMLCGGTLIRPDYVVTAAHCLHSSYYGNYVEVETESLIVKVGVYNRSKAEPHQQLLKVRHYTFHKSYRFSSRDNDIALLKLLHPVRLTEHVGLACLPSRSAEPPSGTLCTITGWGHLQYNAGWSPDVLHTAQVPLVSLSTCRTISHNSQLTRNMLCAGWAEGGPDACQNDSGGPLVCPIPDSPERWALYGVVNFGTGCGSPGEYGVYARVTQHLTWINQKTTQLYT